MSKPYQSMNEMSKHYRHLEVFCKSLLSYLVNLTKGKQVPYFSYIFHHEGALLDLL